MILKKVALSNLYGSARTFVYAPLVFAGLLVLTACGSEQPVERAANDEPASAAPSEPDNLSQQPEQLIVAFGDSLYAGYQLKQNESLPHDLQAALRERGINARVVGAGVSGDTSAAGLARFDFVLDGLDRTPDLVIIGLGGNDLLRGLEPKQTRANIEEMLKELKKRGVKAMLTGMAAPANMGAEYVGDFNSLYGELAEQYGAALYPFFYDGIIDTSKGSVDSNLMLPDGVHPNAEGIDLVVRNITPVVEKALGKE